MSLMSMNRAIRKSGPLWGVVIGVIMVGGIAFTGLGNNLSRPARNVPTEADPSNPTAKPAATVGTQTVSNAELDQRIEDVLRQQSMFGGPSMRPTGVELIRTRYAALSQVKQEQALALAAEKAGIKVTDADIAAERDKVWQEARAGFARQLELKDGATDADIDNALARQAPGLSVARLKEQRIPADRVRLQLYQTGLTDLMKKQVNPTEADVRRSYNDIQVRHILVASGKDGGLPEGQAKSKAEKILAEVKADPAKMATLAAQNSDDPGSKNKGGLYDYAAASTYVPEFTKAALAAGVGKVYPEIVKTQFGYHIIKLEGERPGKSLPKDFDKEKAKYISEYVDKIVGPKVQAAITAEVPNVKVDVSDPLLRAAQLESETRGPAVSKVARDTKLSQALAELAKVSKADDVNGVAPQMRAEMLTQMGRDKDAITAYEEALQNSNTAETRLALAQLYVGQKDNANALKQLNEAEKLAIPDVQSQMKLATLFTQVGEKVKGKAASDKAIEMLKRQQAQSQPTLPPATAVPITPSAGTKQVAGKPASLAPAASPAPVASASPSAPASPAPGASPAASPSPVASPPPPASR